MGIFRFMEEMVFLGTPINTIVRRKPWLLDGSAHLVERIL
jgi:hypothetical protein